MAIENSLRNVFRFIQLRPPLEPDADNVIELDGSTALARELATADARRKRSAAAAFLKDMDAAYLSDADLRTLAIVDQAIADEHGTVGKLRSALRELGLAERSGDGKQFVAYLSDLLLAVTFAGFMGTDIPLNSTDRDTVSKLYRAYALLAPGSSVSDYESPRRIFSQALTLPRSLVTSSAISESIQSSYIETSGDGPEGVKPQYSDVAAAIDELSRLDVNVNLRITEIDEEEDDEAGPTETDVVDASLNDDALAGLSSTTRATLRYYGIDPKTESIDAVITTLEANAPPPPPIANRFKVKSKRLPESMLGLQPSSLVPFVHVAGVGDLLVVKQQIKRYEASEIAHVENVMTGETRSRTHRFLTRHEEVTTTETERIVEEEKELQTADRFELNRETEKTLSKDRKLGFDLSLSGKYGPTIEFSSNLSIEASESSEESTRNASTFAQEVVERSVSRIKDRVLESRRVTLLREIEETNLHEFKNDSATADHVVGIYQFLDKVYEAQVFNYGLRQMFDFMVPEPASFLWYVESAPTQGIELPTPPVPLTTYAADWSEVGENYKTLEILYGAEEIPAPPPSYQFVTVSINHGTGSEDEEGQPRSYSHHDVDVPDGYRPKRAFITVQVFTDEYPSLLIQIGQKQVRISLPSGYRTDLGNGKSVGRRRVTLNGPFVRVPLADGSRLGIDLQSWETASYSLQIELVCVRTEERLNRWKKAAYKKLADAFDARMREYEVRVEELEAEVRAAADAERDFGDSPSVHLKLILTELKKHCISIITQQWYDSFSATLDVSDSPPQFDLAKAFLEGHFIRFFEQAFEWDQTQYVFYPYYWARKIKWVERFLRSDLDPVFQEFLQAGSARVVVPVRPGFELAVSHFMETGTIWSGDGAPPVLGSPTYVSIVNEIMEHTGAPKGEVPVGNPWDVRVPTALVLLKQTRELPEWVREAAESWEWSPVPEPDGDT